MVIVYQELSLKSILGLSYAREGMKNEKTLQTFGVGSPSVYVLLLLVNE